MKHQPYESWLFEQETLSQDQSRELRDHLEICDGCHALATAWKDVEGQLMSSSLITPAPGFTQRRTSQLQMSAVLLTTTIGSAALAFLFGAELLPLLQSAIPAFVAWSGKVANVFANLSPFQKVISILIEATLEKIPLIYQVTLPLCLAGLAALWVVSLHRLKYRRIRKE
jgi:hypothetical protein